jgi:hypothetical protein
MVEATQAQIRAEELLNALWSDGEIGAKVRQAAKSKFPDAKIVDDVVAPFVAPLMEQNKKLQERLDKFETDRTAERAEAEERTAQANLEQRLDVARRNFSLTDDGFDRMVARMKDTGNYADADAAAAWVASKTPPVAPKGPSWSPQDIDLFGSKNKDEAKEKLHRDPVGYQDDVLGEFYRDPDKFVRETLGA